MYCCFLWFDLYCEIPAIKQCNAVGGQIWRHTVQCRVESFTIWDACWRTSHAFPCEESFARSTQWLLSIAPRRNWPQFCETALTNASRIKFRFVTVKLFLINSRIELLHVFQSYWISHLMVHSCFRGENNFNNWILSHFYFMLVFQLETLKMFCLK